MNFRNNSDKLCQPNSISYNAIENVEDISGSGTITEPVTLQEAKDYLRLEGFADDGSGIAPQTPIVLTLLSGQATVTSAALIGKSILSLTRSGIVFYEDTAVGDLLFTFNSGTGTVTFADQGNPGGEPIGVLYGTAGTSSGNVFSFDDDLINSLITEGRMWCENFLGGKDLMVGLIPRTLQVIVTNGAGFMRIPGPVTTTQASISITDESGNVVSSPEFIGLVFPRFNSNASGRITLVYDAGYGIDCPQWAKNAIKAYVADHYEFRGDDAPPAANQRAAQKCRPYRRVKVWA